MSQFSKTLNAAFIGDIPPDSGAHTVGWWQKMSRHFYKHEAKKKEKKSCPLTLKHVDQSTWRAPFPGFPLRCTDNHKNRGRRLSRSCFSVQGYKPVSSKKSTDEGCLWSSLITARWPPYTPNLLHNLLHRDIQSHKVTYGWCCQTASDRFYFLSFLDF